MNKKFVVILIGILMVLVVVLPVSGTMGLPQTAKFDNSPILQDSVGNNIEYHQTFRIDEAPSISFVPPTPENGTVQGGFFIPVNLSVIDDQSYYSFVDFNHDLRLWMRMDDVSSSGEGATVYDLSSYYNNGTAQDNAHQTTTGCFGKGFMFDGVGDDINIPDAASLDITDKITISAWFKTTNLSKRQVIAAKTAGGDNTWLLEIQTNKKVNFYLNAGGTATDLFSVSSVSTNTWYHVVAVYNGTKRMLYLNDVLSSSVLDSGDINMNDRGVTIGDWSSYDRPFTGYIDEVLIFDAALGPEEVKSLYNAKINHYFHTFSDLSFDTYAFTGYANDILGQKDQTETRIVIISITENLPPYPPSNPQPLDGSIDVPILIGLSWIGGDPNPGDILKYDVYLGTSNPPPLQSSNQSKTTYYPGLLAIDQTYYWRVVAWDIAGASTAGPLWSFHTKIDHSPYTPSSPAPANGTLNVPWYALLSWSSDDPDGDLCTYDVYCGTTNSPGKIINNQSGTTADPGLLSNNKVYYWRVIAWDTSGQSTTGPLWHFTTTSSGTILHVGGNGPNNYTTIQAGINAASSGVIIYVHSKIYNEHITVNKDQLHLIGENQQTTIIDGGGTGTVVTFTKSSDELRRFTFRGNGDCAVVINTGSGSNTIMGNRIQCSNTTVFGVFLRNTQNNIFFQNNLTVSGNIEGFYIQNLANTIDLSNTVNGEPVLLLSNVNNKHINGLDISYSSSIYTTNYGSIILYNCQNIWITNCSTDNVRQMGVCLYESSSCQIKDNSLLSSGGWASINLFSSSYNTIRGNTINQGDDSGICLSEGSSYNTIVGNTITENDFFGVDVMGGSNNIVSDNTIVDNRNGLRVTLYGQYPSDNNILSNNIILNNEYDGITLDHTRNTTVRNHSFGPGGGISLISGTGQDMIYWVSHNIINNTIDGKPIIYVKNTAYGSIPSNAGQVILGNCTHYTIQDLTLDQCPDAIQLGFCSYVNVSENTVYVEAYGHGIYSYESSHNTFTHNVLTCTYNGYWNAAVWIAAIELKNSHSDITITDNTITGFNYGIDLSFVLHSNNLTICHNTITSSISGGIYVSSLPYNTVISSNTIVGSYYFGLDIGQSGSTITNNSFTGCGIILGGIHTVVNNTVNGKPIYYCTNTNYGTVPTDAGQIILVNCTHFLIQNHILSNVSVGIRLHHCTFITISECTITHNYAWDGGISLVNSTYIEVKENTIAENDWGVVLLDNSKYNNIRKNFFTNNSEAGIHLMTYQNAIVENTFLEDEGHSIWIADYYTGNNIYHNNFAHSNVWDWGTNSWDNGYPIGGNYWSDYTGIDNNDDGIGDTPWSIGPPSGGNLDHYPLMHPFILGDMNVDGGVDFGDINPFVLALTNPDLFQTTYQMLPSLHGDINQDGVLDFGDINPFVAILSGRS